MEAHPGFTLSQQGTETQFGWFCTIGTTSARRPCTTKRPADLVPLRVWPYLEVQHLLDPHALITRDTVQLLRHYLRVGGQEGVAVGLELAHAPFAGIQCRELCFGAQECSPTSVSALRLVADLQVADPVDVSYQPVASAHLADPLRCPGHDQVTGAQLH
jgi:hypothetical protein